MKIYSLSLCPFINNDHEMNMVEWINIYSQDESELITHLIFIVKMNFDWSPI